MSSTAFKRVKDRATGNLEGAVTDVAATWVLEAGQGANFPAFPGNSYLVTCDNEHALVTARTTDTLTVTRGQDGTAGAAHSDGAAVELRVIASGLTDLQTAVNAIETGGDFTEKFRLSGDISPPQLTANQNDYSPTGLATASVLRLDSDALRRITGLAAQEDGRVISLINVGANDIELTHQDAASGAANRFTLPKGAEAASGMALVLIRPNASVALIYDSTTARWRAFNSVVRGQLFSLKTFMLKHFYAGFSSAVSPALTNTVGLVGLGLLQAPVKMNKLVYKVEGAGSADAVVRIAIYNELGDLLINVTDAVGVATGVRSITIATPVWLLPGNFYTFATLSSGTTGPTVSVQGGGAGAFLDFQQQNATDDPVASGTVVVAAGAAPSPLGTVTYVDARMPLLELVGALT